MVPAASVFLSSSVCHVSCASCSGPAAAHCIACVHPQALRQGHCLPNCGEGFYPDHGICEGMGAPLSFLTVKHKDIGWLSHVKIAFRYDFSSLPSYMATHMLQPAPSLPVVVSFHNPTFNHVVTQNIKKKFQKIFQSEIFNLLHVHDICGYCIKSLLNLTELLRWSIHVNRSGLYANARPIYKRDSNICTY